MPIQKETVSGTSVHRLLGLDEDLLLGWIVAFTGNKFQLPRDDSGYSTVVVTVDERKREGEEEEKKEPKLSR